MKKSKLLLVSSILSTIYLIFLLGSFILDILDKNSIYVVFTGFKILFYLPHLVILIICLVLNWVGYAKNIRWTALMAGILYLVCMFFMLLNTIFVFPQMVLSFIAYSNIKDEKNIIYKNTVINKLNSNELNSNDKK